MRDSTLTSRRIALLTQHYPPEPAATGQLAADLARGLADRKVSVTVYTAQPSYGGRARHERSRLVDGVYVQRVFSFRGNRHHMSTRLLSAGSYCLSVFWRLLFARRSTLVVLSNPPILPWAAWAISVVRRFPYMLVVHDVYPDAAIRLDVLSERGFPTRVWRFLNRLTYGRAAAIVVLGERMREVVAEQPGVDSRKLSVVHNWADPLWIRPLEKGDNPFVREHDLLGKLVVLYAGNMGRHHDLETILETAERCRDEPNIVFLFVGDGAKKASLMAGARERGLGNVEFLPYEPREQLPYMIPAADIGVVSLERGLEGLCVPSKLYTYLAAGVAILGLVGPGSEVAQVLEEYECGFRVDQTDITASVAAVRQWANDPATLERHQRNARSALEMAFSRGEALRRYREILDSIP